MKIADLFCGAGGAAMGLHRAGFEVVGFDIEPQNNYPFEFHQQDALTVDLSGFDAVWASPPCQAYIWATKKTINSTNGIYPKLIAPTRALLVKSALPYIIENGLGAPLLTTTTLTGLMFGLKTIRRRNFESNIMLLSSPIPKIMGSVKNGNYVTVAGHGGDGSGRFDLWSEAMDIDWMTKVELKEAIPPAYSEFLGKQLIAFLESSE